jgi:hypothetical protein
MDLRSVVDIGVIRHSGDIIWIAFGREVLFLVEVEVCSGVKMVKEVPKREGLRGVGGPLLSFQRSLWRGASQS